MAASIDIQWLCDENLMHIFSYLNVRDLAGSVQHVCWRWKLLSSSSKLWKYLQYRPECDDEEEDVIKILKFACPLRSVCFDQVVVGPKMIETLANNCCNIHKLDLGEFKAFSVELMRDVQRKCPHLEHLTIQESILYDINIVEIISDIRKLRTLVFLQDPHLSEPVAGIKPLADGCPSLENLDIKVKIARTEELEYLLDKKKHKLKHLGITCWTEDGFCTLPLLSTCTQLSALEIRNTCNDEIIADMEFSEKSRTLTTFGWTNLGSTSVNLIRDIFSNNSISQLTQLNLSRYANYEDRLINVIAASCPLLKEVNLAECCSLTDESLKNLQVLRQIQTVKLCATRVTDYGVFFLVLCKQLRYIDLSCCCYITGRVLLAMARLPTMNVLVLDGCNIKGIPVDIIPARMKALKKISIHWCCGISEDDINRLRNKMPLLQVEQ